jgi:hypothetical protein
MKFDGLILLSGFELQSRHPHFGGISGLSISGGEGFTPSPIAATGILRECATTAGRLLELLDWQIKALLTPARTASHGLLPTRKRSPRARIGHSFSKSLADVA